MINRIKEYGISKPSSNIIRGYSDAVKIEIEDIINKYNGNILNLDNSNNKRKNVIGFTIDGKYSKDLDDAIGGVKRTDKGGYIFETSISDVAAVIKPFSQLDLQALQKSQSEYLLNETIHMFPNDLSTDILSLNGNTKRLTKTYRIELDQYCDIINVDIFDSVLYNKKRYNYDTFEIDFNNPNCKNYHELQLFYEIASKLKKKNKTNKREDIIFTDDRFNFSGGIPQGIIEEIMIITNTAVSKKAKENSTIVANRVHMPEYKHKEFLGGAMDLAYYSSQPNYHLGLGNDNYMHITSPIRRYSDLISSRLLDGEKYSTTEINSIIEYINKRTYLMRGKVFEENKRLKIREFLHIKTKAIRGDVTHKELNILNGENFEKILYYYLGQEKLNFPKTILKELKNRIAKYEIGDEIMFLLFFGGNKTYTELSLEYLRKKYDNPYTYLFKFINSHSPVINGQNKIHFYEKSYKSIGGKKISIYDGNDTDKNISYNRIGALKYNGILIKKVTGNYNSNAEGKRDIKEKVANYIIDKKINFSKQIVVMKNYNINDIIDGEYSLSTLKTMSVHNLEEVIIYFITNKLKFTNDLQDLILSRIENNLFLSDLSISALLFSKNKTFLEKLIKKIYNKQRTRNIIKFLRMNKDFDIMEKIIGESNYYGVKVFFKNKMIVDISSNDNDITLFIDEYSELINYFRLVLIENLLEFNIDYFEGINYTRVI